MALIVQKYGGTSVADAKRIKNVARRIAAVKDKDNSVVIVVSAMGNSTVWSLEDSIDYAF